MAKLPPNPFKITVYYSKNTCIIDEKHSYQALLRNIQQTLSQSDWELFVAIYIDELPLETILHKFHLKANTFYMKKARIKRRLKKFSKNFDEK